MKFYWIKKIYKNYLQKKNIIKIFIIVKNMDKSPYKMIKKYTDV